MRYPIGVQSFSEIREGGFVYVDKTPYIRMLAEGSKYYFLSRPRRFGKSLFVSTLQAFFEGKRSLFKGLAIDGWKDWMWECHPVIHLDLNAKDYTYKESLYERIHEHLVKYEALYGISSIAASLDERFRNIIETAYKKTGLQVVVLIDEYDKPILDTAHDGRIKYLHHDSLRAFYSTLKSSDPYLKFCFLTGVTKFGQMNIFSGLNNIQDISILNDYSAICGISEEELHRYLKPGIESCAKEWDCTVNEVFAELKHYYDGYHFSPSLVDVYNPWSTLNAIGNRFIDMYWNSTGGGMAFMYKLLEKGSIILSELNDISVSIHQLRGINDNLSDAIPLLYQTGYLTIKDYNRKTNIFRLKFPNYEVETGFVSGLLPAYSGLSPFKSEFAVNEFVKDLSTGNAEGFLKRMQTFFEDFPNEHSLRKEEDFQNIMYCISKMMGLQVEVERHSARGNADMIILTDKYVYVMEFKVNRSPEDAMVQLETRGYAKPFEMGARQIIKAGIEFSTEKRNIAGWLISID